MSKHEHSIGRYTVRTEWKNNVLYYDIFRSGQLVTCGFDALSIDEETAMQGIIDRLYGKGNERAA